MDLNINRQIQSFVEKQLGSNLRYRCLLVQSNNISLFPTICQCATKAAEKLSRKPKIVEANQMLDEIGAHSCNQVTNYISEVSAEELLIISGPLHFLDYWTKQQCSFFWGHLACLEKSIGIIMVDVIRSEGIQGVFTVIERISNTDIRYLKSRRAILEANIK